VLFRRVETNMQMKKLDFVVSLARNARTGDTPSVITSGYSTTDDSKKSEK
jgi:hypothetical protein